MRRLSLVAVTSAVLAAAGGGVASAHPLGNFTINHYAGLAVRPDTVIIDYVIDMAEIPAFQERSAIDRDGDGVLSEAELAAYGAARCVALRSGLSVRIDGHGLPLSMAGATATLPVGQAGLSTLRLGCLYSTPLGVETSDRSRLLEFADVNYAERIGWREITARGDGVHLDTSLPTTSLSARLSAYPQDLLASPLDVRRGAIRFTGAGPAMDPATPAQRGPAIDGRPADPLASLIGQAEVSPIGVLAALLLALGLGAFHALTPGHGKTVLAAYLVGTRGTRRQALFLALAVALSHTAGVLGLAVLTLAGSAVLAPERAYPYLSTVSGALVVVLGAWMVATRARHAHAHHHGHEHDRPTTALGWRSLAALGLAGGLVPSASALVLLLGAISLHRSELGLVLVVAFGLGMAAVLVGVGQALVGARGLAERRLAEHGRFRAAIAAAPSLAAVTVLLLGLGMTAQSLAALLG